MKSVLIWTLLANRHQFNLLSQREGYFPQSPNVRFLGTVHPFGEYLRRKRRNFRWSCDETVVAISEKCLNLSFVRRSSLIATTLVSRSEVDVARRRFPSSLRESRLREMLAKPQLHVAKRFVT